MFLGEFQHSLDTKGRVILPAKYRDQLADGAFVTKGKGGCLSVFTPEEFEQVATQIREQSTHPVGIRSSDVEHSHRGQQFHDRYVSARPPAATRARP